MRRRSFWKTLKIQASGAISRRMFVITSKEVHSETWQLFIELGIQSLERNFSCINPRD